MEQKEGKSNQLNVELPEEVAEGTFVNLAMIAHSSSEFVIDFIRMMPNLPKAKVKSRIIITPEHAKKLLHALHENIQKYEKNHGSIDEQQGGGGFSLPMNFGGGMGEA